MVLPLILFVFLGVAYYLLVNLADGYGIWPHYGLMTVDSESGGKTNGMIIPIRKKNVKKTLR